MCYVKTITIQAYACLGSRIHEINDTNTNTGRVAQRKGVQYQYLYFGVWSFAGDWIWAQVKFDAPTFTPSQKAGQIFLAGIGANVGGGSRRLPELCCISLEVTSTNPVRNFR
jgi:hypothetical protein